MNKYRHPKSSLFLMEIMINILFFAVLVTICLQLFFKAHNLSEDTTSLHRAVTACTSIAEVYQSNHDGKEMIMTVYPHAIALNSTILIYFDETYRPCSESDGAYRAVLDHSNSTNACIKFFVQDSGEVLYSLEVSSYIPRTIEAMKGGLYEEKE